MLAPNAQFWLPFLETPIFFNPLSFKNYLKKLHKFGNKQNTKGQIYRFKKLNQNICFTFLIIQDLKCPRICGHTVFCITKCFSSQRLFSAFKTIDKLMIKNLVILLSCCYTWCICLYISFKKWQKSCDSNYIIHCMLLSVLKWFINFTWALYSSGFSSR